MSETCWKQQKTNEEEEGQAKRFNNVQSNLLSFVALKIVPLKFQDRLCSLGSCVEWTRVAGLEMLVCWPRCVLRWCWLWLGAVSASLKCLVKPHREKTGVLCDCGPHKMLMPWLHVK